MSLPDGPENTTSLGAIQALTEEAVTSSASDLIGATARPAGAAEEPVSILLVDDNEVFVRLLSDFIRRTYPAAEVGTAGTGALGLEALLERDWDVVLLDYRLPDCEGYEVLAEVRKRNLPVAVVMVTGEGDETLAAELFRMGAHDYLVKSSIDPQSLRRSIDQVIARRRLETQISAKSDALVATSRELAERTRALEEAYSKLRDQKEELRRFSESLEVTVNERTAALASTTSFLNQVLDSTSEHVILATDGDGSILTFNRGAELVFGQRAADAVGSRLPFRDLFEEIAEDDDAFGTFIAECRSAGTVRRELTGVDASGRRFQAQITVNLLLGPEPGFVIVGTDVTHERELERQNQAYIRQIEMANVDLRRKNEQILEATRLKSEFIANVSHELRTPLNAIIGYADLLLGGIYGELPRRQETAIEGITTRSRDLLALINDILDLAKIESGRMDMRADAFILGDVLHEVLDTGRVLAVDKNIEVSWSDDGAGHMLMRTDRQKLQQILLNLTNNAVKFTPRGLVRIESHPMGDEHMEIAVIDTGIGIPESDQEGIFDEFRQVDGTSTREYGGTGLGLAISRKFAVNLGGDLTVKSVIGEGSTFRLVLPRTLPGSEELSVDEGPVSPSTDDLLARLLD